jgi:hypothetical protein
LREKKSIDLCCAWCEKLSRERNIGKHYSMDWTAYSGSHAACVPFWTRFKKKSVFQRVGQKLRILGVF